MKITNLLLATISIFVVLLSGCGMMGNSNSANARTANNANQNANQNMVKKDLKPADFTFTAEEWGKEFRDNQSKLDELHKKYKDKTIAFTGRIYNIVRKNRGDSDNTVLVYTLRDKDRWIRELLVSCNFQETDGEQIEPLRAGDTVTLQGFNDGRYITGSPPDLMNCAVVENGRERL